MASHISQTNSTDDDPTSEDLAIDDHQRLSAGRLRSRRTRRQHRQHRSGTDRKQSFRCRKCRQVIGAPLTGGRHRNHCPNCLHSLHVDNQRPGDRRSHCGSLMAPAGVIERRNGEQLLLHECLNCGKQQPNRVAADDNPLLLMRLAPVAGNRPEPAQEVDRAKSKKSA